MTYVTWALCYRRQSMKLQSLQTEAFSDFGAQTFAVQLSTLLLVQVALSKMTKPSNHFKLNEFKEWIVHGYDSNDTSSYQANATTGSAT